jgi:hypothetical protein
MGLDSYHTARAMLHRYRSMMVRPGRDRLRGDVEVDESILGGPEPACPGRAALGVRPSLSSTTAPRVRARPPSRHPRTPAPQPAHVQSGARVMTTVGR